MGQFGVDGRHLDGGWAQCGVSKVVIQELHGMLELVCWWASCDHIGNNICSCTIGEVTVVMRWWWTSRMTGRCKRSERWSLGSGGRLKVLNWNLHLFKLLEIKKFWTQYPGSVVPLAMFLRPVTILMTRIFQINWGIMLIRTEGRVPKYVASVAG